jgi:hypothetical protein
VWEPRRDALVDEATLRHAAVPGPSARSRHDASAVSGKVSIFLAGVQRAGTTTLFEHLKSHPELLAPHRKETHFFDDERVSWPRPDYRALDQFYDPSAVVTRHAFDATPITIFWEPAIPRILEYNPSARFIVLFRDPIERAWSNWRFGIAQGHDDVSFDVAIREGRRRLQDLPKEYPKRRYYSYVERGLSIPMRMSSWVRSRRSSRSRRFGRPVRSGRANRLMGLMYRRTRMSDGFARCTATISPSLPS